MKEVRRCVICESENLTSRRGGVAPFLAERIWHRKSFAVSLLGCGNCGFVFFSPRLEAHEEERLYSSYRSNEYQEMRYAFEPWYTKRFHHDLFSDATMRSRRESLKGLLAPHLQGVRSILDFGGGRGELISDLVPGAACYVYEVSGAEPLPGMVKLQTLSECNGHHFDLIICSNVLEHVGYPRDLMQQLARAASPGTLVFVEVPYESPLAYAQRLKRLLQQIVLLIRRPQVAVGAVAPRMLYLMHEHVNFFSKVALRRLVSCAGLAPVADGVYGESSLFGSKTLWNLAERPGGQPSA